MPSLSLPRLLLSSFALALTVTTLNAAPPNRIAAISSASQGTLAHTVNGRAKRSSDLGPTRLDRVLTSVTLHFNMTSGQQAALNKLIVDQQNPQSPLYHQWLTPAQYGAQFGLSSADLAKVSNWLTLQGLTVTAVAPSSNFITVSGTVAQVQNAFKTSIHDLNYQGEQHFTNISDPVLPRTLADIVNGITGLNDFRPRTRARSMKVQPQFTSSISGNHFVAPGDFYSIYDVGPLLSSSTNGAGITIAVVGQTDISLSDVAAFRTASGLSTNAPTVKLYGTDPGISKNDIDEAQLDVEWSGAIAPSASILYVNSNDVIGGSLLNAITSKLAPIISISYGSCESDWGQSTLTSLNQYLQQANVQGQTIVGPGGDSGATDCDYNATTAADGLAVDFPASSPFVTSAGGTMFNEGTGTFWGGTNGSNQGSANGYIPEAVWNESGANGLSAGGGGASAYFAKPAWQVGAGVPADLSRDVPDISLNSASSHDGYLYCVQGSCVTGYRASDGQTLSVVGGTSVAAPAFAGILALLEQKLGATTGLGNVNPQIYGLANSTYYANAFHDVTTGNNSSACIQGSPNCATGTSIGYTAGPDYDLATGWGSIDAYNFVTKWSLASPAGSANTIGSVLTSTTVTTNAPTCGISGGSLTLSIGVANSVANSSAVPTGSVQILVDSVGVGSPVPLTGGATSYKLDTSALSSGGHTVSAVYLGDSTFAGSKGTLLTDVVSTSQADFAITPCTAATSATAGGTAAGVTLTVNAVNGFAGPVAFTASADSTLSASYKFSVTPVVVSSGGSNTTVFTLFAYQTNASGTTSLVKLASAAPTPSPLAGRRSIYATGSGIAFASVLLWCLPRKRRLGTVLLAILSVSALGASGCGSGGSLLTNGTTGTGTTATTTTPAAKGTYVVTVTGVGTTTSGTRVHSMQVTLKVL